MVKIKIDNAIPIPSPVVSNALLSVNALSKLVTANDMITVKNAGVAALCTLALNNSSGITKKLMNLKVNTEKKNSEMVCCL